MVVQPCEALGGAKRDHVRTNKDVAGEEEKRGLKVADAGVMPGCEMSIQTFSRHRNRIRVWPPDWMTDQGVQPVDLGVGATSTGMWPYEEMWEEDGGHRSNDERRAIAEAFFDEVRPGETLAFFYVDERNPLFVDDGERSPHRVLVGISRITEIGDIEEWNEQTYGGETNMVWSVPFKHAFPTDGIRFPVQALSQRVPDPEERAQYLVPLDGYLRTDFRYGSATITMDRAVAVIERAITALGRVRAAGVLETSVDEELAWLNSQLLELWEQRGPYPGLAPVLAALDFARSAEFQRDVVPGLTAAGADAAEVVFAALEGDIADDLAKFDDDFDEASFEWGQFNEDERELARLLVRMELTFDHVDALLSADKRERHGLPASAAEIVANPYLLSERFIPNRDREPIGFLAVDHALLPHESMARVTRIPRRDPRRLRALLVDVLRDRADEGDTFVAVADALEAAARQSPDDRRCEVPAERLLRPEYAEVVDEVLDRFMFNDQPFLALHELRAHEEDIASRFDELVARPRLDDGEPVWQEIADGLADEGRITRLKLSSEQEAALQRGLSSPLSVITGAAGTGKSTLLAPLISAVQSESGKVPILALAPTGKAADRLNRLGVEAMTIHRALAVSGWYDWDLGVWTEGETPISANTLIIDECSMIDIELLGTLFAAIDWHDVNRLVLVGDHHQLPPIGPGRPFFDVIARMQAADASAEQSRYADRLNELTHNYRVEEEGSRTIALANGFARLAEPDDPQIWSALAKGQDQNDLKIRYWDTPEDLQHLLIEEVEKLVAEECAKHGIDEWQFDATLGHNPAFDATHWQIVGPVRGAAHGTRKLNAVIQDHFHRWAKFPKRAPGGAIARWPIRFGQEQITARDKVIQVTNERLWAYDVEARDDVDDRVPVFNGQIGRVCGEWPRARHKYRSGQRGPVKWIKVQFDGLSHLRFDYRKTGWRGVDRQLELAYAITVHKSQGSQFKHVFFVVPTDAAAFFGRELTYMGLTRAESTLTLFVERDLKALLGLRKRAAARTPQRNSRLFAVKLGGEGYRADDLVHVTTRGEPVRSKSEVIIANLLHKYEQKKLLSYEYEQEVSAPDDEWDLRLPDFTVAVGGKTFLWEHCGKTNDPIYMDKWERCASRGTSDTDSATGSS